MEVCARPKLNNLNCWISSTTIGSCARKMCIVHFSMRKIAQKYRGLTVRMAASTSESGQGMVTFEEGQFERPRWTGETPLSRLVGALISFKPLYSILKFGARQVLISTAEKTNIPWQKMTREILESDVYKELESIEDPSIVYPDYYLKPFHAYDEGNLTWLAAAEAEAATLSMVRRAIPSASSVDEANEIVRGNWLTAIEKHHQQFSGDLLVRDILDIGCSVGVSTRYLADKFPSAKVTVCMNCQSLNSQEKLWFHKFGAAKEIRLYRLRFLQNSHPKFQPMHLLQGADLSPYFLAVAQFKEKKSNMRKTPICWLHANGEATGLPSKSFDIVSIAYVFHECPERAIKNIVKEAFRLLKPGGTFAVTDNSPKSKILQELPPVLFVLMKSTEPFLDEYYLTDLEGVMRKAGFINVQTVLTDPRHRTVTATVPYK